jgi:hypothetical protein
MSKLSKKALATMVDDLGVIKAKMAVLKTDADKLRTKLLDAGITVAEGDLFRATVVDANRTNVDWKAISAALKPSRQLVTAHTSQSVVTSIRVTARTGKVAA